MLTSKIKSRIDYLVIAIIVIMLMYSTFLLARAHHSGVNLGNWVWDRHQNLFSWYSRPLFIVPACYYAYKRKIGYVFAMLVLMGTSLFWFDPPIEVSESVSGYLEWERQMFMNPDNVSSTIAVTVAVCVFLFLLFYSLWQRNFWIGLFVFNLGNILKITVSVVFGGDSGVAAVVPTMSSVLILNLIAFFVWRWATQRFRSER